MENKNYKIVTVKTLKSEYFIPLTLIENEWRRIYLPDGEPSIINFKETTINPNYKSFQMQELIKYGCKSFKEAKERLVNYILNYENSVLSTEETFCTKKDLIK
jgi:hypothetical protein